MARSKADVPRVESGGSAQGWAAAIALAVAMLLVSFTAFAVVPNWLLDRLATRVTTTGRDLILVGWWAVAFAGSAWVFVRLQVRER